MNQLRPQFILDVMMLQFKLERDDALDKVSEFDSKSIALKSQIADYENLVGSLQQRVADLEADLAVKEQVRTGAINMHKHFDATRMSGVMVCSTS